MIRINLISTREVEEASSRKYELALVSLGLAAVLGSTAWLYFSQQEDLSAVTARVKELETRVAMIRKQNQEVQQLEQQKKTTEEKLKVVRLLTSAERRSAPIHILDDLSSSAKEYLWLIAFSEVNGSAKINGQAVDNQTIAEFARDLARSKYFQRVEIRETAQEDPGEQRRGRGGRRSQVRPTALSIPVKRFLIEATINYLPSASQVVTSEDAEAKKESVSRR
ncbi:MAG: PilN domain-containing protein [Candidatus Binatia bacterium]